ncbi:MAG: ABC transporter substrate-binding protein [Acidimicrobiia bacterium]
MRIRTVRMGRVLAVLLVFALIAAACGDDDATTTTAAAVVGTTATTEAAAAATTAAVAAPAGPVVVCELAYYTGEFAAFGEFLTAGVTFPIEEIINLDPPLGRPWEVVSEDLGTVGEGQAARTCLEQHGAEILVSPAHGYRTYRDFMTEWLADNDSPLMPTVHGGTIPGNLGGIGSEPIFRAQGLDEALGMTGSLYAESIGAETAVIFATQVEGFQIAATAAALTADAVGLEVLARIDVPAEQASYRAEAERIADLAPDVVIVQAGAIESSVLIKEAAEAGASLLWIGETGWAIPEFMAALGTDVIPTQDGIGFAAFDFNDETPAWEFYSPLWEGTPGFGDSFGAASDQYHFSAYDLLVHTALAVEYGGSYNASDWAPAMFAVGDPPGTVCFTYADCLALIRAGEEIDYEGVTGPGTYSEGGVNSIIQSYAEYGADGTLGEAVLLDPDRALEVINLIAIEAVCDANNVCDWGG